MEKNKIYTRFHITYPVKFNNDVREKVKRSLEYGLRRSLPKPLRTALNKKNKPLFNVEMKYPEPVAYVGSVCGKYLKYDPKDYKPQLFGVFDFGGGTLDYSFGIFAKDEDDDTRGNLDVRLPSAENRMKIFNQKLEKYSFTFNGKVYYNEIQAKTVNMSGRDIENFVKMLNERIKASKFKKISNLGNDNESRNQILRVLEINEQKLIADLQKEVPVQVLEPSDISMKVSDIIGYDSIKERIQRQADYIKYSEENKSNALKFGVKISKGIMLYGPPGNAKTMLAQAVAKDNNFYFVKVLSKDFTSDSISKQLDNLQVIFDQVIRLSKMCSKHDGVILFFDEFDSLAYYGMSNVIRGTLLDYLASGDNQEDEGIRSAQSRILLMVATNFKEKLDPAVIRKGRVDDHLLMDNPTEYAGIKMLEQKIERDQSVECKEDVDLSDVYERLTKYVRNQVIVADEKDKENIRPSGSAIIHLFDELKYEAYFNAVSLNKPFDKLFLTQALITSHFESLF